MRLQLIKKYLSMRRFVRDFKAVSDAHIMAANPIDPS
jgi:hypothetical protein